MSDKSSTKTVVTVSLLMEDVERLIREREEEGWTRENWAQKLGEILGYTDCQEVTSGE